MTTPHWFRDLAIVRYDYYHNKSTKKPGLKTRVSYEEIATAFGLTKGRISQIIASFMDGKTPEHYAWKKVLEKDWAGAWTLAKLTNYQYKIGLDPAFVFEQPKYKKGELHWYEWILCENGGIVYLYDEKNMIFHAKTTTQTAEKVLAGVKETNLSLSTDERLGREIRFPVSVLAQVCELAGARKARKGRVLSEEEKANLAKAGINSQFKAA